MKTEKNILVAFILNISFSLFELIGGIFTNSVSIISDSFHDFSDAISTLISYFLEKKSKREPDNEYTFGYTRYSVLGAFITNTVLIVGSLLIVYHAVLRIINPQEVNYEGMIFLSIFGVLINFLAVYFTKNGHSLNQKAVNLHMLEDVLGWAIVLIGSIIMKFTEINIIDAILSILVALFILINAIKSLKKVLNLVLEKIPDGTNLDEIKKHLKKVEGVVDIHHVHLWSMDGLNNYMTMHVVINSNELEKIKRSIKEELKEFNINHSTIEFENPNSECFEENCQVLLDEKQNLHHHHH